MKRILINATILALPFLIYSLIVIIVDPYNYFKLYQFTTDEVKHQISPVLNYPLWKIIQFTNNPCENILLGDSRMGRLDIKLIEKKAREKYYNFAYDGGTIEESISTFWRAKKVIKLKKVIIGINFNNFNANDIRNRVPGALEIIDNPLLYLTNWNVLQATTLLAKEKILDAEVQIDKPSMSRKEFWNYKLNIIASRYYSNYKYPSKTYAKLTEIKEYCNKNGIEMYFVVLPTHVSLQNKIKEFGLEKDNELFLQDLRKLGPVYNFDLPSEITKKKDNFVDPYHFCVIDKLTSKIINDIFIFKKPLYSMYMMKINLD